MTLSFPTGRSSVLGRSLDEDVGGAGVGRGRLNDGRRHPGPLPGLPGDLGEGVAAEPGDEADLGAQPPGGHGLVRALAARPQHELPAEQGLAEPRLPQRSEEHTSELQSLMRISYAVFCLKKKKIKNKTNKER